jgi:hypothetical protein
MISLERVHELEQDYRKGDEIRLPLFSHLEQAQFLKMPELFFAGIAVKDKSFWVFLRVDFAFGPSGILGVGGLEIPIHILKGSSRQVEKWPALSWMATQNKAQFNGDKNFAVDDLFFQLGLKFEQRGSTGFIPTDFGSGDDYWLTIKNAYRDGIPNPFNRLREAHRCVLSAAIIHEILPPEISHISFPPVGILQSPIPVPLDDK